MKQVKHTHTELHPKSYTLCGISFPCVREKEITRAIQILPKGARQNLYFLYSEYFVRAARNQSFKAIFSQPHEHIWCVSDGRGVDWASYVLKNSWSQWLFKHTAQFPRFVCIACACINSVYTLIHGWVSAISRINMQPVTKNQIILGRDYIYTLFEIAQRRQCKVLLVGAISDTVIKTLQQKYPALSVSSWSMPPDSDFMQDKSALVDGSPREGVARVRFAHQMLTTETVHEHFPPLKSLFRTLETEQFDIILVACGGASGKQEFLMDYIQRHTDISYMLCAGVGAALDHMGAGQKQAKVPDFIQGLGLEFMYRMVTNPARAYRILDTVIQFWILTSLHPVSCTRVSHTYKDS